MEIPQEIEISNLAESVWNNAAKELQEKLATQPKLIDKLNALAEAHKKETHEHKQFKRRALKSMVDVQKLQAINVYDAPPKTNAWNQGDYRKIREPEPKKKKKKAPGKSSASAGGASVGGRASKRKRKNSAMNLGK